MIHERYDVYQKSLAATRLAAQLLRGLPPGQGWLADQLKRAVAAGPLLIAEGLHRSSRPDRERFFAMARASLGEAAAALDVGEALGVLRPAAELRGLLVDCVKMLYRLRTR